MIKLAPSILAADFAKLGEEVKAISDVGCEYVHIDVMDGHFVPNISLGPVVIQSIRSYSDKVFDVHLMIDEPIRYVDAFVKAGADSITIHEEACDDLEETLAKIKSHGIKKGMSIKPATPIETLRPYIKELDMVLIMSVNPGFGGQSFMPESLDRIAGVKKMAEEEGTTIDIQVDGGIYHHNIKEVLDAGANIIVGGTSVFKGDGIAANVAKYREIFKDYN